MSHRYYEEKRRHTSLAEVIIAVILLIFVSATFAECNREDAHMVYINDGYVYHEDSHIIYIENQTGPYGRNIEYIPYYDSNGKMNRYDEDTGKWIPVN